MKILIAGLGSIGRRHLRNLMSLGERDIILYRSRLSTLPDEELAGFPVETTLSAALAHRPDAVIVSNPTALHLDVAIPAAEAGCHLLLEKPVSDTMERVEDLREAVRHGGGQVLVGFQFRFHPTLQHAAGLLAEGAVGRPVAARAHWGEFLPGWHAWEDYRHSYSARADLGGGVVLTLCHPLHYLGWLLGEPAVRWAFTGALGDLDIAVEDIAEIGLVFPSGAVGSVHLNYLQQPPAHHLDIVGTQESLHWNAIDGSLRVFQARTGAWTTLAPPAHFERNSMFLEEARHFLRVARGDADPMCTLDDGISTLRLATHAIAQGKGTVNP